MKKKVLIIILVLAAAVGVIAFKPSLAWLNTAFNKSQDVSIGALKYSFDGEIKAAYINESTNEYVIPGENLIYELDVPGNLTAFNLSTITTNLRVSIEYTYWNGANFVQMAYGDETDDFTVAFNAPANWDYDAATKCWKYKAPGAPSGSPYEIPAFAEPVTLEGETTAVPPVGDEIALIDSMGYSDTLTAGNPYEDANVSIKLTVEVKQADYVNWTTLIDDVYP